MLRLILSILLFLANIHLHAQQVELVKDINPGLGNSYQLNGGVTNINGQAFFGANDGVHGDELYRSDGSSEGTYMVKDIYAGNSIFNYSSRPFINVVNVNNLAFFRVGKGQQGYELWRSDGTSNGTILLNETSFTNVTDVNGIGFFWASDLVHSSELWRSDGTHAGTYLIKDINVTSTGGVSNNGSHATPEITSVNGAAFFWADDGVHGAELYRSDGTANGTYMVKDINPGSKGSINLHQNSNYDFNDSNTIVNINGIAFFYVYSGPDSGLWRSDGTEAGTYLVKYTGPTYGILGKIANIGGKAFFWSFDISHGFELWRSDGTGNGTYMIKDIYPGMESSYGNRYMSGLNYGAIVEFNGLAYFEADDNIHGRELWRSDGTEAGTYLVKDINPGIGSSGGSFRFYSGIAKNSNAFYFGANDGVHGGEIWRSDGTEEGTFLVKDINPGSSSSGAVSSYYGGGITNVNGTLYFWADDGVHGWELWKVSDQVKVEHFHQLEKGQIFKSRKRLTEGTNFKVCADDSEASIFKITGGNQDYSQAVIKNPETDISIAGSFSIITRHKDSLIVRYRHPDQIPESYLSTTLTMGVYSNSASDNALSKFNIIVYRAPVLMVHGLWSDSSAFNLMEKSLYSSNLYLPDLLQKVDYRPTNYREFSYNERFIPANINLTINRLINKNISVGKVDYIGHSMGGILGRMYLQSDNYSFDLHKLITINTPHSGSEMGNLITDLSNPVFHDLACKYIARYIDVLNNMPCNGGAISDLCVNSNAIRTDLNGPSNLNKHVVPSHAIVTYTGVLNDLQETPSMSLQASLQGLYHILYGVERYLPDAIFSNLDHDQIVSAVSQRGGLTNQAWSLVEDQQHIGSPGNESVIAIVKNLLRQSSSSFMFCQTGFAPAALNYITPDPISKYKSAVTRLTLTNSVVGYILNLKINSTNNQLVEDRRKLETDTTSTSSLTDQIVELRTIIGYNEKAVSIGKVSSSSVNYTMSFNQQLGKHDILVLGKTASGTFTWETTNFSIDNNSCYSITSGDWSSASTWSCGHEPTSVDVAIINPSHVITISTNSAQAQRIIYNGGTLKITSTGAKVFVNGSD